MPSLLKSRLQSLRNLCLAAAASFFVAACTQESASPESMAAVPAPAYNLTLSMADFMEHVVQSNADTLWKSAGWILDEHEGYYELYPTDDEGWLNVYNHGATMVEIGNAMQLPGRTMDGAWSTYAEAISTVGLRIMAAAEAQNNEDLFQGGAQLYSVCTACHQAYSPDILAQMAPAN